MSSISKNYILVGYVSAVIAARIVWFRFNCCKTHTCFDSSSSACLFCVSFGLAGCNTTANQKEKLFHHNKRQRPACCNSRIWCSDWSSHVLRGTGRVTCCRFCIVVERRDDLFCISCYIALQRKSLNCRLFGSCTGNCRHDCRYN